jgi:hypothetical protein
MGPIKYGMSARLCVRSFNFMCVHRVAGVGRTVAGRIRCCFARILLLVTKRVLRDLFLHD